jgi:hypothetical protein
MITAHYTEIRSRKLPGQPTETIIREVQSIDGRGRKTVRVLRGNRTVSAVSEPLTPTENTNIQVRRFTPNLYASSNRKTLKHMKTKRLTKKAHSKTRRN